MVLVATLSLLFFMFVIAMALQYREMTARSRFLLTEAEFQAEQAADAQLAAQAQAMTQPAGSTEKPAAPPSGLSVTARLSRVSDDASRAQSASSVLANKLPDAQQIATGNKTVDAPFNRYVELQPGSLNPAYNVFGHRKLLSVVSTNSPWAAYAPKGSITLADAVGYANPKFKQQVLGADAALDSYSGLPVELGAGKGVTISGTFPNGDIYVKDPKGKATLANPGGAAYFGTLPGPADPTYEDKIMADIRNAWDQLDSHTQHGDKSAMIWTEVPDITQICGAIFQGHLDQLIPRLSLAQAMAFPMPMIPSFSTTGIYTEITLHMPYPPSGGETEKDMSKPTDDQGKQQADALGQQVKDIADQIKSLMSEEALKQAALDQTKKAWAAAVDATGTEINRTLYQTEKDWYDASNAYEHALPDAKLQLQAGLDLATHNLQNALDEQKKAGDQTAADLSKLTADVQTSQNEYNQIMTKLQPLLNMAQTHSLDSMTNQVLAFGGHDGLATAAQEANAKPTIDPDKGAAGWNYFELVDPIKNLFNELIHGDFNPVQIASKMLFNPVRVITFGPPDNYTNFSISPSAFNSEASWTVPRGRTLRFDHSMTIKGDLWVQRGACMYVDGNLTLMSAANGVNLFNDLSSGLTNTALAQENPATPTPVPSGSPTPPPTWAAPTMNDFRNPGRLFAPQGRILLEEGATLVVTGNITAAGSADWGSVMVEGKYGEIHPITSAILCKGKVSLPYGIYPSVTLDSFLSLLKQDQMAQGISSFLASVAPNVAKFVGPFKRRLPYLASYATTIGIVATPFGPIPIPVPEPYPNADVKIFRGLSLVYSTFLNFTLGENLYLQCDWWPFGTGGVPMLPKLEPGAMQDAVSHVVGDLGANFGSLIDWKKLLPDIGKQFLTNIASDMVRQVLGDVIKQVVAQVLNVVPGAKQASMLLTDVADTLLKPKETGALQISGEVLKSVGIEALKTASFSDLQTAIGGRISTALQEDMARECPGILVYGETGIDIGDSPFSTGMFVAGTGDINIKSKVVVGSMLSQQGNITAKSLYFFPYFTQASLYVPQDQYDWTGPFNWAETGFSGWNYGVDLDSKNSVDIGEPVAHVTASGWSQ
jgi:hypothetical protein